MDDHDDVPGMHRIVCRNIRGEPYPGDILATCTFAVPPVPTVAWDMEAWARWVRWCCHCETHTLMRADVARQT